MNTYIENKQEEIRKSIDYFTKEISTLRTGRATASILDKIMIPVYGTPSLLSTVSSITIQDARSMIVTTWDKNLIKEVEKAISDANLGVGVSNEGDKIRVTVPLMTEENRKNLVKQLGQKHEDSRISVRQIRDDIKSNIEKAESDKEITEDDKFRYLRDLEEKIKKTYDELSEIKDKKESDIMTI